MLGFIGWVLMVIGSVTEEEPTATTLFHVGVIMVLVGLTMSKQDKGMR